MSGTRTVGEVALELMEQLTEHFGDDARIGTVAVIAEVDVIDEDGDEATVIATRCTDPRLWVQVGLFDAARRATLDE